VRAPRLPDDVKIRGSARDCIVLRRRHKAMRQARCARGSSAL